MRDLFKENRKYVFIISYAVIILVAAFNYERVLQTLFFVLNLLQPLFLAVAIAFVLNIPMSFIERQLKKVVKEGTFLCKFIRPVSMILTLIFALIFIFFILVIVVPSVTDSAISVFGNFNELVNSVIKSSNKIFEDLNLGVRLTDISFVKELQKLSWQDAFKQVIDVLGNFADGVITNVVSFTNSFFQGFLAFCLSLYLLAGKEKLQRQIRKFILATCSVKVSHRIFEIGSQSNYIFKMFIGGQLVDCAIKGIMFYFVCIFLGFPLPELLATIITVCSIVPVFGPMFAMVLCVVLIFAYDPMQAIWFIVVFQVLSNLEGQVIYPKIVGKSIGLPGVWVLLSVFVLGDVMGVLGMILAVPITAIAYDLVSVSVNKRIKKKKVEKYVDEKIEVREI